MGAAFSWQLFYLANAVAGTPVEGCSVDEDQKSAAIAALEEMDLEDIDGESEAPAWPVQAWTGRC